MAGRVVEGGEVVVVVLDLGPLHHAVTEAHEDVLDLAAYGGQHVQVPDRGRPDPWQRHIDGVPGEAPLQLGPFELLAPPRKERLERLPRSVGGGPHGSPLRGGELSDRSQDRRQLRLPSQVMDA
jgi:hypothetical protein